MAYRRRPVTTGPFSTSEDEIKNPLPPPPSYDNGSGVNTSSLAAKAIRASSAFRDFSLSSAYGQSTLSPASRDPSSTRSYSPTSKASNNYEYTSKKNANEPKQGLWSVLARKAKSIIEDDSGEPQQFEPPTRTRTQMHNSERESKYQNSYYSHESRRKMDNPTLQKGLGAITSSLNYIGGSIGNAVEEGITIMENRTADIIQETRKHIRKKPSSSGAQNQAIPPTNSLQQPQMLSNMQTDQDIQLKASRDVAMAMAAKAKLLLRELKTIKADLAFAKERCAQLEDENKILRESRERGSLEDDDMVRLQLETLLAEKARLANENSIFARENRFLREVVEYHQLTMQDVVYLDENTEEVSEVYPVQVVAAPNPPQTLPTSPANQA